MQKDENKVIDEEAQAFLRAKLPKATWQVYELSPDIAKDHPVELVEKGEYQGLIFVVQLKGQREVEYSSDGNAAKYQIETKYLKYYFDQLRLPVFLILVDLCKSTAYWLFIQRYVIEKLREKDWRSQQSVVLHLPINQNLDDLAAFRSAVQAADGYMIELHPAGTQASIKAEQQRYESYDPRFKVSITATEKNKHYLVQPTEVVSVKFHFKGKDANAKIDSLINKGMPVTFAAEEIRASGSPLFDEILKNGVKVQWGHRIDGKIVFRADSTSGVKWLCTLPAILEGGLREMRITVGDDNTPLFMQLSATPSENRSAKFHLGFNQSAWIGTRLSELPAIEQISQITSAIVQGSDLIFEILCGDLPPFPGRLPNHSLRAIVTDEDIYFLSILSKAKELARFYSCDAQLGDLIKIDDQDDVILLYDLMNRGIHRKPAPGFSVTLKASKQGAQNAISVESCNVDAPLILQNPSQEFGFFGRSINVGPIRISLSKPRLANRDRIIELLDIGATDIPIELIGTSESECTFQLDNKVATEATL